MVSQPIDITKNIIYWQEIKGFWQTRFQRYNLNDLKIWTGFFAQAYSKVVQKKANKQEIIPNYLINEK